MEEFVTNDCIGCGNECPSSERVCEDCQKEADEIEIQQRIQDIQDEYYM